MSGADIGSKADGTGQAKAILEDFARSVGSAGNGLVNRSSFQAIFEALNLPDNVIKSVLDCAEGDGHGRIDAAKFMEWLFEDPPTSTSDKDKLSGDLDVATINFLGNDYNAFQFMEEDDNWKSNYAALRQAFFGVKQEEVLNDVAAFGWEPSKKMETVPGEPFEKLCSEDFLKRDNKVGMAQRTNLVSGGMVPIDGGLPLFHCVANWRDRMKEQKLVYDKDPELLMWDIACNLACERCKDAYTSVCKESYLNPALEDRNVETLIAQLPVNEDREIICAVQEFPDEDSHKFKALVNALTTRRLKIIKPKDAESVGWLLSDTLEVRYNESPLGRDAATVLQAMGHPAEGIEKKDMDSLTTTSKKTSVLEIAETSKRPALRVINVHCKEFKSDDGLKLLVKYLMALAGKETAMALLDANTPNQEKAKTLDATCQENGIKVLSPATESPFWTTQKQRSEMHGQIYDQRKCMKVVKAHKDFCLLFPGSATWEAQSNAERWPNLTKDPKNLPNKSWPSDHCMLQVVLNPKR